MLAASTNGNKYITSFIDDYTKMTWLDLLKTKFEAFENFQNFHAWVENETQSRIGIL